MTATVELTMQVVVKDFKSQHMHKATLVTQEVFRGNWRAFKTRLWDLAEPHIKGFATYDEDDNVQIDYTKPTVEDFSNFVMVAKHGKYYTFAGRDPWIEPLVAIMDSHMPMIASGDAVIQVVVCAYGRHVGKQADFGRVMAVIQRDGIRRLVSPEPRRIRLGDTIENLRIRHPNLKGEWSIWHDWALKLHKYPATLKATVLQPPPPDIAGFFEEARERRRLLVVQRSLSLSLNVISDSKTSLQILKRSFQEMQAQLENYDARLDTQEERISPVLEDVRQRQREQYGED
ncbi:hypothetical protein BJ741DRAFT_619813 [Chytriomyces cf. hyalinus JEL632]|nr:hypothetical protein BJ741DRAFT_619813 [Chytriomyces cf. hyalinus JEL632]